MKFIFSFFLRLFGCFVASKFFLMAIGSDSRSYLIGLTLLFLANVYWFERMAFRDRSFHSPGPDKHQDPPSPPQQDPSPKDSPPGD